MEHLNVSARVQHSAERLEPVPAETSETVSGSRAAMVERLFERIVRVAHHIDRTVAPQVRMADELVQETSIRILSSTREYGDDDWAHMLPTVVRNLKLGLLRRASFRRTVVGLPELDDPAAPVALAPDDVATDLDVRDVVAQLDADTQEIAAEIMAGATLTEVAANHGLGRRQLYTRLSGQRDRFAGCRPDHHGLR